MCFQVAELLSTNSNEILVCSTGVIGVQLPMDAIGRGIAMAHESLSEEGGDHAPDDAASADTVAVAGGEEHFPLLFNLTIGIAQAMQGMI